MNWGGRECIIIVAQVSWKLLYFTSLLRLHFTKLNKLVTKIKIYVYIYMNEFRLWTKFVRTVRPCSFPRARCHSERCCDWSKNYFHSLSSFPCILLVYEWRVTMDAWKLTCSSFSLFSARILYLWKRRIWSFQASFDHSSKSKQFHDWIIRNWKSALNFLIQSLDLAL